MAKGPLVIYILSYLKPFVFNMKKCKRVLGALCMSLWGLSGTCALALDNVDADGMPVIYLRGGDIGEVPWGCSESLRFERNGQNYSLHVDRLSGEFKIGTV